MDQSSADVGGGRRRDTLKKSFEWKAPAGVAALSPHCDDLAFSLGGAIWDRRFAPLQPIGIFSHSAFSYRLRTTDPEVVSRERKAEDCRFYFRFPWARPPRWLDRPDAPLRLGIDYLEAVRVKPDPADEAEARVIADLLRPMLDPGFLVLAPLALGGHVDHRIVRMAAGLLVNSGREVIFYEDLPYAGQGEVEKIPETVAAVEQETGRTYRPQWLPSVHLEASRRWGLECYASQTFEALLELLLAHPRNLAQAGKPCERIWIAAP
ncbi:MAG: hypothetical protein C4524_02545 [Candidatus Zixiibacteriota bacterium]|nr:MAG: hypothetical protein C4524_02545 [candidate division Zixibacteria bacterium]